MKSESERIISKEKSFLSEIWRICPIPEEIFLLLVHCKTMSASLILELQMLRSVYQAKKRGIIMEQNKISRRNFLRVAGASATAAAMSGLVPAASAAGIKDLWSMDLQILATSDTHGKFDPWDYAANKADAPAAWPSRQLPSRRTAPRPRWSWMQATPFRQTPLNCS